MRYWWVSPKEQAGGMAVAGGFIALIGLFSDRDLILSFLLFGVGLLFGFGATYCLLDDPEEEDLFPLKVAARLGFLSAGLGLGAFIWKMDIPQYIWVFYLATALPLLSLARLLLRRRWKVRRENKEKAPWEKR